MNRLRFSRCYLCGAMDRALDAGVTWRREARINMGDIGIFWLDPTRKPIKVGVEDDASRARRKAWKAAGEFKLVSQEMAPIRRVDLRMVDICDFLIVNLDMDIHACGTYEEIFLANRQKKPILIHCEQGVREMADWMFGVLPYTYFFDSWEDIHEYVRHVSSDDAFVNDGRWYFFDWMGDQ